MTKVTGQDKHHAKQEKKAEPISRRYFLICQTCFWCASYIETICNMDELPYKACSTCNDNRIESLPISYDECYHFEYTPTRGTVYATYMIIQRIGMFAAAPFALSLGKGGSKKK